MSAHDVGLCLLSNPLSPRYAAELRAFSTFQSRVPVLGLVVPVEGPLIALGGLTGRELDHLGTIDDVRPAPAVNVFQGGVQLTDSVAQFATELRALSTELGVESGRLALENMSPLVTVSLLEAGFSIDDAQRILEPARAIKSSEEIACMKWSIAVCEHAMSKMRETLRPGIRENQLWALLNFVNIANDGEWHDSQQLTSGPRTKPAGGEATDRVIEQGDLVAFDTDMIGPFGYCADISRTFHCGPCKPTPTQKDLYQRATDQLRHNLALIRPGVSYAEIAETAYRSTHGYQTMNLVLHGIGMSDELPMLRSGASKATGYDGVIEAGMTLCLEAYATHIDANEGVKLEEQVLVTENGYEMLTHFPLEDSLL